MSEGTQYRFRVTQSDDVPLEPDCWVAQEARNSASDLKSRKTLNRRSDLHPYRIPRSLEPDFEKMKTCD